MVRKEVLLRGEDGRAQLHTAPHCECRGRAVVADGNCKVFSSGSEFVGRLFPSDQSSLLRRMSGGNGSERKQKGFFSPDLAALEYMLVFLVYSSGGLAQSTKSCKLSALPRDEFRAVGSSYLLS